jgi:transglutaminase-like putative cysteine protease
MLFTIRHHTRYRYSKPVTLSPHILRFYPRDDGSQRIVEHRLKITPEPQGYNDHLDLEGNRVAQVWFTGATSQLEIEVTMQVQTLPRNPFGFILAPEAITLPIEHVRDAICARAYLERILPDDSVTAFAAELSLATQRDTVRFLDQLNHRLFDEFKQVHRDFGEPQSPAYTLEHRSGACRDLAVLFVDCCRAEGIAARFASGYQKGNLQSERRHLHAWPEVYLPGAGWRGYDPTHGAPCVDDHVTVAAAANAQETMPVSGVFTGTGASSTLDYQVQIQVSEEGTGKNNI